MTFSYPPWGHEFGTNRPMLSYNKGNFGEASASGSFNLDPSPEESPEGPLEGYRALDLTDDKGFLCGRILADIGVNVIKIEPPGGEPSRMMAPFYKDIAEPEKSLYWFAYNANKRSITLKLDSEEGRGIFKKLVKGTDFVIESFPPGHMEKLGLDFTSLKNINPRIILTSISAFGQSGPYADYKATDLVGMAMSGLMYLCGDPDECPVRISFPQAYLHAGGEAAVGTLVAHYHREMTGEGQWVDVSMQQSVFLSTFNASAFWQVNQVVLKRAGAWRTGMTSGVPQRQVWPCQDGFVNLPIYGGTLGAVTNRRLVKWMDSEGKADEFLKEIDWNTFDMSRVTQEVWNHIENLITGFFQTHTKEELYQQALERNIMIYPVNTVKDIARSEQLKARQFWVGLNHPELDDTITYPGAGAQASLTPMRLKRRAPLVGEHNQEVYCGELGLSQQELASLEKKGII